MIETVPNELKKQFFENGNPYVQVIVLIKNYPQYDAKKDVSFPLSECNEALHVASENANLFSNRPK